MVIKKRNNLKMVVSLSESIFEISNRFVEDLVQLAILNKEILGKDNTFSLNEADDFKPNKESLLTPRSKDPSTERTNQIMKRRRSMPGNNCDRGVDLKPQKTM